MYEIEISQIENTASYNYESFLQSPMWAQFKSRHGWNKLMFSVSVEDEKSSEIPHGQTFYCSVLVRSFAKNLFSLAYIPMVPLAAVNIGRASQNLNSDVVCYDEPSQNVRNASEFLCDFAKAIKQFLPQNTICVRYDLPIDFATVDDKEFFNTAVTTLALAEKFPLRKNKVDIQPPDTVLLDLKKSEDEILAAMKSKWRYNVRLAQKKGVEVRAVSATDSAQQIDDALEIFYSLYKTTAERDGIAIHAKNYYRDLFTVCAEYSGLSQAATTETNASQHDAPLVTLYTAYHEGDALAAIITLFTKNEAVYLYGASSNVKRNMMPAYLLQWTAICDAKKFGSVVYDFYGIPPTDDEAHPMHGLYLFKTGFGGREVHRPGSFDVPTSPVYTLYTQAENARSFFFKKIKKLFRSR